MAFVGRLFSSGKKKRGVAQSGVTVPSHRTQPLAASSDNLHQPPICSDNVVKQGRLPRSTSQPNIRSRQRQRSPRTTDDMATTATAPEPEGGNKVTKWLRKSLRRAKSPGKNSAKRSIDNSNLCGGSTLDIGCLSNKAKHDTSKTILEPPESGDVYQRRDLHQGAHLDQVKLPSQDPQPARSKSPHRVGAKTLSSVPALQHQQQTILPHHNNNNNEPKPHQAARGPSPQSNIQNGQILNGSVKLAEGGVGSNVDVTRTSDQSKSLSGLDDTCSSLDSEIWKLRQSAVNLSKASQNCTMGSASGKTFDAGKGINPFANKPPSVDSTYKSRHTGPVCNTEKSRTLPRAKHKMLQGPYSSTPKEDHSYLDEDLSTDIGSSIDHSTTTMGSVSGTVITSSYTGSSVAPSGPRIRGHSGMYFNENRVPQNQGLLKNFYNKTNGLPSGLPDKPNVGQTYGSVDITINKVSPTDPGVVPLSTQMALFEETLNNLPVRSDTPQNIISKNDVFNFYNAYKNEIKQQQNVSRYRSQPILDMYSYADTDSEESDIIRRIKQKVENEKRVRKISVSSQGSKPISLPPRLRSVSPASNEKVSQDLKKNRTPRTNMRKSKSQVVLSSRSRGSESDIDKIQSDLEDLIKKMTKSYGTLPKSKEKAKDRQSQSSIPSQVSSRSKRSNHSSNKHQNQSEDTPIKCPVHGEDGDEPMIINDDIDDVKKPISRSSSESSLSYLSTSSSENEEAEEDDKTPQKAKLTYKKRAKSHSSLSKTSSQATSIFQPNQKALAQVSEEEAEGKRIMMKRWWSTLGDIPDALDGQILPERKPEEIHVDYVDISMATTASYIPGVSLADKLRLAASKGQFDKVKELVANGASFEPDREGRTALHYAALNGYAEVAQLLAIEGCDIDAQDNLGYTALHRAAAQGHLDVIKVLMSEGCLVDRQDEVHGNTAIHEASWNGYSKTLELLVKNRASCNLINKAGFSPLHLAAQNGHNQSGRVLLYAGTNSEHKNNYGDTALHTAARYGHAGVTRILISARCDINMQNKNGDTALHISAALKRRKISKLLVDGHCDVSIKNKQNEMAIDVARRKDHPEIVLIITSQAKPKKDKKKEKKAEKKEKKGFFFRKKKAKEAKNGPSVAQSVQSIPPSIAAPSEISSARYNPQFHDRMPPEQLLQGFQRHQAQVHHQGQGHPAQIHSHHGQGHLAAHGVRASRGANTAGSVASSRATNMTKQGLVGQYASKDGVAYYKDLAGNIKQGPIGFAPVCNCGPQFKKLEQRVDADKANLYDHIDASHRMLNERLTTLDSRTAQQVYAIDRLTKERLEAAQSEREEHLNTRLLQERLETERQLDLQQDGIRTELKAWVDSRLCDIEEKIHSHEDCCDWGHTRCRHRKSHKDHMVGGRLYRSKSDETLSVSSSHPGKKVSKLKSRTMQEMKKANMDRHRDEKRRSMKSRDRTKPIGHQNGHLPSGRTPDGQSFTNSNGHNNWTPVNHMGPRQSTGSYITPVIEEETIPHNLSDSCIIVNSMELSPVSNEGSLPLHPIYPSPEYEPEYHQVEIHHSKTDSGSNPDSGYGSKIYGAPRPSSNKSESIDGHNISTTTDGSGSGSSPTTFTSGTSENGDPLHVTRHFFDTVSSQMEKWYERRLMEVEKKAEDRVRQESVAMQSRIQKLEDKVCQDNIKMSSQIEACEGTQV